MGQKYWLERIKLKCIRYLKETHDERDTISSADGPVFDTYWIYLVETISDEEKRIREDLEADFNAKIEGKEEERKLIVDSVDGRKVLVRQLKESENAPNNEPFELKPEFIEKYRFEIRYFFRETEREYASPIRAAFERLIKWNYVELWAFRAKRSSADKNITQLKERTTVLEKIIELEDERDITGAGANFLASEIYGPKYSDASSQVRIRVIRQLMRIIESLKHTKELQQHGQSYRTTGKAIASLFDHKEMLRRHEEAKNRDTLMIVATIVIALAAAIQAAELIFGKTVITDFFRSLIF